MSLKKLLMISGMYVLPLIISAYINTLRIKINNIPEADSNSVYIFWHSKMLVGWWLFKNNKSAALVSQSKDGDILNNILTKWKYNVVRGSNSKGSREALTQMINLVKQSYSAVITPDGPRGPAGEIKNGALIISNKCSVPVIPVRITYSKKKILENSWDKFEIPLPFSKCTVDFGGEYFYENYLDEENLSLLKKQISSEMN